ncbi:hypothetical protein [Thermicanus aegyptius]|uniref:hypothetical protein n=1 Tax=Thermicanus aegyptius TaxID=94009 RepID=UPI000412337D|nr:hypothetical protein [Thermicanus aegyptius]
MDEREYMGVLTSPFTTEREKERVLRKIRERYMQEKSQENEIKLFGHFIDLKKFPVAEEMVQEGHKYGITAKIKDRYSISMPLEGGDVRLFVDEEFITKGTYNDVKREIKRLKKIFEKTTKEMEEMHTGKKERPQIEQPSWTKHLWGRRNSYEVSKDGLKVGVAFSYGISVVSNKSRIKMSIMPEYYDRAIENIFNAIAENEGLIYVRQNAFQSRYAAEYGYYTFAEEDDSEKTLLSWNWEYKYMGYGSKKKVMKNIEGKVYRAGKLSDSGFYKISHETQKSIWLEPAKINIYKYLEDFEEDKQHILLHAFQQRKKYQDSEKEERSLNDLEKELDNLERIGVSAGKAGTKAKI